MTRSGRFDVFTASMVLAVVLFGAMVWFSWSFASPDTPSEWVVTDAVITTSTVELIPGGKQSAAYVQVTAEFTAASGQTVAVTWRQPPVATKPFPRRGDVVSVAYDPDDPARPGPVVTRGWVAWGPLVGLLMLPVGMVLVFISGGRFGDSVVLTGAALVVLSLAWGGIFGF